MQVTTRPGAPYDATTPVQSGQLVALALIEPPIEHIQELHDDQYCLARTDVASLECNPRLLIARHTHTHTHTHKEESVRASTDP
jgi:hypothetical protein